MSTLSSSELDALMSAIHQGMADKSAAQATHGQVISYDLTSQDRVIRAQLPTLDSINDKVASSLSVGWGGRLRMMMGVTAEASQLRKFADFHAVLRPPATFVLLQLSAQHGPAVLVLPDELVRVLLGAALGDRGIKLAPATGMPSEARAELTNVERSVLSKLVGVLCDALASAWAGLLPINPRVLRFETDPRMATVAPPGDVVIINGFQVGLNDDGGHTTIHLGIPFAAVEPVKKNLAASPHRSSNADGSFSRQLSERLEDVPVEVRALLGRARMTLKDFLALQAGDLLPLDTCETQKLPLLVQGVERARGTPTVEGSRLALNVVEVLPGAHPSPVRSAQTSAGGVPVVSPAGPAQLPPLRAVTPLGTVAPLRSPGLPGTNHAGGQ